MPDLIQPAVRSEATLPVVAGAASAILMTILKQKWGISLDGQEANVVVVVMGAIQHFMQKK